MRAILWALSLGFSVIGMDAYSAEKKRLIVKYKKKFSNFAIINGESLKKTSSGAQILEIDQNKFQAKFNELKNNNDVEYVEEDIVMNHFFEPGDGGTSEDPKYSDQWHYFSSYGANLPDAWEQTLGSSSVVVAVVDTGYRPHQEFIGRVLPGADMISDSAFSNDGGGRDNDATDPGDWVAPGDFCYQPPGRNSSWHGTHVAGTILANSGNGVGAAGVNWNAKLLPVRVLGKCGGLLSDIADGVRWAAGGAVAGVSNNSNPAKVINLSLGGRGPCSQYMQESVNFARSQGAVVIVAAGNDGANLDWSQYNPANCNGVITVGASNRFGDKSGYSNYGEAIDVMGPGGDFMGSVLSLGNSGTSVPGIDSYTSKTGTSMAAPHVAGVASLIFSITPDLFPAQVEQILKDSASTFSNVSSCTFDSCGNGLLDAGEAVRIAAVTSPDGSFVGESEPVTSGFTPVSNIPVNYYDDDGGGACGSVDLKSGPGGGGGFMISLLLGLMFSLLISKNNSHKFN